MSRPLFDAQAALGFVIAQTSHIEQEVNAISYPDIQYPGLIPVDTSANPFVKSVTYFSMDKAGAARWVNGNADDVPNVSTNLAKFETQVHTAAIGYGYGYEEVNQAQLLGINLSAEHAIAARRAYEEFVDRVALIGDAEKGYAGLFDYPGVPAGPAQHGNWESADADKILTDINNALNGVFENSNTTAMADTLLLPWKRFNLIASKRLGDTTMTVLDFLRTNNIMTAATGQPLLIRGMRLLDGAGANSGGATTRMVAYRRDPLVLKLHIPMPHRFLPAYQSGPLRFDVPGVFRMGGLDIRRPREVIYVDGI